MRILFDQGTPVPLRTHLVGHIVSTAFEKGWSDLKNGDLLKHAAAEFDVLISTDQNLRHQQGLAGSQLAVLVSTTTSWPRIRSQVLRVIRSLADLRPGQYREVTFSL